jgi:hypothetical protein
MTIAPVTVITAPLLALAEHWGFSRMPPKGAI